MANEPIAPVSASAPSPAAAPSPAPSPVAASTPAPTPVVEAAPAIAPVAAAAPVTPDVKVESAPVEPVKTEAPPVAADVTAKADAAPVEPAKPADETVLGAEDKKPEEKKPEDSAKEKAAEGEKKDGSQSDEPAPLPSYEAFTAPEGISFDEAAIGAFTKELGEFELASKADHAEVQKLAQSMLTKHVTAIQETVQRIQQAYQDVWAKQTQDWRTSFENDPEIGGNHKDTTINAARESIRRFGGTEAQQKEFRDLMQKTGIGNHPAMIRMLANINLAKAEGKIVPATAPVAQPKGKMQKMYGVGPKKQ